MPHSQASSASWSPASLTPDSGCHPAVPLSVLVPLFQGTSGRLFVDLGVSALRLGGHGIVLGRQLTVSQEKTVADQQSQQLLPKEK